MVISVHVPKCAGTSFRRQLGELCEATIWNNYGVIFSRSQARRALIPSGTTVIHGHFIADAFDDLFPGSPLITWVRHPVERLVSSYHHSLRSPDMRDDCCRMLHERGLDLRGFAQLEWKQNEISRYLAHKPVDAFAFVGISERYDESMGLFCERFGFRDPRQPVHENANPERTEGRYGLSEGDYRYFAQLNSEDMAWYEAAVRRLESGIRAFAEA